MKNGYLLLILLITQISLFAHHGDLLDIKNVKVRATCEHVVYEFEIENTDQLLLKDVKIELHASNQVLATKQYDVFAIDEIVKETFVVTSKQLSKVNPKSVKILVTEIFGQKKEWGGWLGLDPATANYNDLGDFELYADAPWRMKIYDENNNANPIPIAIVAHDGNNILSQTIKCNIEFIDVYVKKSTDSNFGDAIDFTNLSSSEIDGLFEDKSPDSLGIGVQPFDSSKLSSHPSHTFAFNQVTHPQGYNYTHVNNEYWYSTLMLPGEILNNFDDSDFLDIWVKFTVRNSSSQVSTRNSYLRVFRSMESIPKLPKFYRGDTHVHTLYSHSILEFGNPIGATKIASRSIGLDWLIVTDHTSDFDNWKDLNIQKAWQRLGKEIDVLNAADPSLPFIRGQEISLLNRQRELVHFLAYPGYETPTNLPYLGDGGGDIQFTNTAMQTALDTLGMLNGFAYAAHPFATADELPAVGGLWNVGDSEFPYNGLDFDIGGKVQCNKVSEPSDLLSPDNDKHVFDNLKGAQIWGVRFSLIGEEVDPRDPYNMKGEIGGPQMEPVEAGDTYYLNRYRQGEQVVNFVNLKGLRMKNANPELENYKFFFSAGTDAHGAFNYSNTAGAGTVFEEENTIVSNYNLGNIACVAYCPNGMGPEGGGALEAMFNGAFTLSDGPILAITASLSGDNNQNDVVMGMDTLVDYTNITDTYINFQFASSTEFGVFEYLKVFIGTNDGEASFMILDVDDYEDIVSINLADAFIEAGIELPVNQYFYVRAELQTEADYSDQAPRILSSENFNSFTNPIWMKIDSLITSTYENELFDFNIYPNPTNEMLRFETSKRIQSVLIFSADGKLVDKIKVKNQTIDVSNLAAGNYTLEVKTNKENIVRKFVVY